MLIFQNVLVPGSRRFVKEGVITEIEPRGGSQDYHFFMFNDLLVWTKPRNFGGKGTLRSTEPVVPTSLKLYTGARAPKPLFDFAKLMYVQNFEAVEPGSSSNCVLN